MKIIHKAIVTKGKFKGKIVKIVGQDIEVWNGTSWLDTALPVCFDYGTRMLEMNFDEKEGKTFCCEINSGEFPKPILFHEKQLYFITDPEIEKGAESISEALEIIDFDNIQHIINFIEDLQEIKKLRDIDG